MGCGDNIGIAYDVPGVVRAVISIIKFMAPILIILLGSVDLFKVVFSGEKEIKKVSMNNYADIDKNIIFESCELSQTQTDDYIEFEIDFDKPYLFVDVCENGKKIGKYIIHLY